MRRKPLIVGWKLVEVDRLALLRRFVPVYPDVIAHHVTLQFDAPPFATPPEERLGEVVGHADDGAGVEALVLRIGGTTNRPGGGTYHITWSLDRRAGRKPVDSNRVLAELGWTEVPSISVHLQPSWL